MGEPYADRGCAHPLDRAGGPTDLSRDASQPKALIPCAEWTLVGHFQWNSGWKNWEQVIPEAANEPNVIALYTLDDLEKAKG